jgi:archaellum component FlaF (FlaF/FlaG flagellin family)
MQQVKDHTENGAPGKRQIMIIISTLVILGSGFAYYFFGYVKVKEANLNEMGFRVLSRLGTNIVSKKENFVKNAKNIIRVELKKNSEVTVDSVNSIIRRKEVNKDIRFTQLRQEQTGNKPATTR